MTGTPLTRMSRYQVWWLMPEQTMSTSDIGTPRARAIWRWPFCTPWQSPTVLTPPYSSAAQVIIAIGLA